LTVAESGPGSGNALRVVATAANDAEAAFQKRLAQAGTQATLERVIGGPEWGASGARYIYVAAGDFERAREVLEPPDEPEPIKTT
jgi:hypothetical protein